MTPGKEGLDALREVAEELSDELEQFPGLRYQRHTARFSGLDRRNLWLT